MGGLTLNTGITEETRALTLFDPIRRDQRDRDAVGVGPCHEDLARFRLCGGHDLIGNAPYLCDRGEHLFNKVVVTCTVSSSENS
jgi:hypothetical protein